MDEDGKRDTDALKAKNNSKVHHRWNSGLCPPKIDDVRRHPSVEKNPILSGIKITKSFMKPDVSPRKKEDTPRKSIKTSSITRRKEIANADNKSKEWRSTPTEKPNSDTDKNEGVSGFKKGLNIKQFLVLQGPTTDSNNQH